MYIIICTADHRIVQWYSGGWDMWHACRKQGMYTAAESE